MHAPKDRVVSIDNAAAIFKAALHPKSFVSLDGADARPSPCDLLSAALGTCMVMTLRMYARQKGLPLDHVRVRLKHSKIHASDCEHSESASGRIDRIEREIELRGALDEAQRPLEIADKCPVHRTLHREVDVATRLAP